jgi:hypothetical protein
VHHAVHLATLRKQCESSPLKLLKKYKTAAVAAAVAAAAVSTVTAKPKPQSKSNAPAASSSSQEDLNFRFDNLESVPDDTSNPRSEANTAAAASSGSTPSSWTSVFTGGSKASKFAVP